METGAPFVPAAAAAALADSGAAMEKMAKESKKRDAGGNVAL